MTTCSTRDRYISFNGLDCDANASRLLKVIHAYINRPEPASPWRDYLETKRLEKDNMAVDDLFFVGSQLNNIYTLFDELGDETAHELLYQVEQKCCGLPVG